MTVNCRIREENEMVKLNLLWFEPGLSLTLRFEFIFDLNLGRDVRMQINDYCRSLNSTLNDLLNIQLFRGDSLSISDFIGLQIYFMYIL